MREFGFTCKVIEIKKAGVLVAGGLTENVHAEISRHTEKPCIFVM